MPVLTNFPTKPGTLAGRHWETGTLASVWAYRGITVPHTGQPYSEALLMGISGGAVMGYFSFAYEGYDPMARILTRNTFDPVSRLLDRLGVPREVIHTSKADKGLQNVIDTLEAGTPPIVFADMWSLPYNALDYDEGMWGMYPVVVYGIDDAADTAHLADRARVPLTVPLADLAAARGRVKKDKFRVMLLDPPVADKLPAAVQSGIWDTIKLYTEAPPKGSKNNFGLAAFDWWIKLLTRPRTRLSWEKVFPAGGKFYAGLTTACTDILCFGKSGDDPAERGQYAAFLEEASTILDRPALRDAANRFRQSADAWGALANALLADDVSLFAEARDLHLKRHTAFLDRGNAALDEMRACDARLAAIRAAMDSDFPLSQAEVEAYRARLADHIAQVRDAESAAVTTLQSAMI
jgi:hypothetical protein